MKSSELKQRLKKDKAMSAITLRMPENVVNDLKRIAPDLGFSGYQPLLRFYVGQGLRRDLAIFDDGKVQRLVASLKRHGVDEALIAESLQEAA
ncbi:MAG: hypothetical protein Q9M14_06780 [Mariprofundaceae bacterium]|nr:hypothetical protein [Mariprofundaceae bacterium]